LTRRQWIQAAGAAPLPPALSGANHRDFDFRHSRDGLLETDLRPRFGWLSTGGGQARLFAYDNFYPGPVLEARPGDTVRILLINELAEPTNLHFHGLRISPLGSADNSFLHIPPGEQFQYEFQIPYTHPAGTFWYHPHLHGFVASQVFQGLAGAILIRGELDRIPEVSAAREHLLVLQDLERTASGQVRGALPMERMQGREGNLLLVNGAMQPSFRVPLGSLARLRILNASPSRHYRLRLEDHPFHVIATDGGSIPAPVEMDELLVAPGERIEALIVARGEPGAYRLWNLPYDRGGMGMRGSFLTAQGIPLATLEYEPADGPPIPLPSRLIPVEPLPNPVNPLRRFQLGGAPGGGMMGGMSFTINGRAFDPARVDTRVRLGDVEDWEILNPSTMDHPFHLHTNAFQPLSPGGDPVPAWKDVLQVPARSSRRLRVRFDDFPGRAFYHCHILDHEDLGMMGVIEMVP
jgi:FtsP/CotA-like multicopper oxidase with cupredoxin domain